MLLLLLCRPTKDLFTIAGFVAFLMIGGAVMMKCQVSGVSMHRRVQTHTNSVPYQPDHQEMEVACPTDSTAAADTLIVLNSTRSPFATGKATTFVEQHGQIVVVATSSAVPAGAYENQATAASVAMCPREWTALEALYHGIVTATTVGYGKYFKAVWLQLLLSDRDI